MAWLLHSPAAGACVFVIGCFGCSCSRKTHSKYDSTNVLANLDLGQVMKKNPFQLLNASFGFVLLALVGCGPSRGDLSGTVTYKGKSIVMGSVLVVGGDGVPKQGGINPDGTYAVKEIVVGSVKIAVSSPEPQTMVRKKEGAAPDKVDRAGWIQIPDQYSDPQKSNLTFELKSGPNSHNIELK